jgi:hypothetical protein
VLAIIPPTLAAANITYSGFSSSKKEATDKVSNKSNSLCVREIILVYPFFSRALTIALPTKPLCPAT